MPLSDPIATGPDSAEEDRACLDTRHLNTGKGSPSVGSSEEIGLLAQSWRGRYALGPEYLERRVLEQTSLDRDVDRNSSDRIRPD